MPRTVALALTLALLGTPLSAQTHSHTPGMAHPSAPLALPTEPGQGAFAAIAEIVTMLRADPVTDWSRVNIDALRAHLVDMDMLVTHASVASTEIDGGLQVIIATNGEGGSAAQRMVLAHSTVLAAETGWASEVVPSTGTLTWTVTSPSEAATIRALGFFGLMAFGDHHRSHHLALAKGQPMH